MLHMVPRGTEVPVISEAISTPAGSLRDCVLELSPVKHHQGRAGKILEVPVCDLDLIVFNWEILLALRFDSLATGHIPLAPTTD